MPVNPIVLQELIKKYGKKAVGAAVNAAKAKVMVPNMTGTATAASTSLGSIPKVESTVGKEAAVAAAALSSPYVLSETAASAPLWGNAAKTVATDIPAYMVLENLPTLWGGDTFTEQAKEKSENAARAILPDGELEDKVVPAVGAAVEYGLAPLVLGGPSHILAGNTGAIESATADYINGVKDRAAEAVLRMGDDARKAGNLGKEVINTVKTREGIKNKVKDAVFKAKQYKSVGNVSKQFLNKNTLNYIFNPYADPGLAYNMPLRYSGREAYDMYGNTVGRGDVIDQFLRKVRPLNEEKVDISELPENFQAYFREKYPKLDRVSVSNLGNSETVTYFMGENLPSTVGEVTHGMNSSAGVRVFDPQTRKYSSILDPGHYHEWITKTGDRAYHVDAADVYKYNADDFMRTWKLDNKGWLNKLKKRGLAFIDSRGEPIVYKWQYDVDPNYIPEYSPNEYRGGGPARRQQKMFDRVSEKIANQRLPGEIKDEPLVPMEQEIMSYTDAGDPMQLYEAGQMVANGQVLPGVAMAGATLLPNAVAKPLQKAVGKAASSVAAPNAGKVMRTIPKSIMVSTPERVQVQQILDMVKRGEMAPLETVAHTVSGEPVELPDWWSAALRTDAAKHAYSEGVDYFWRGFSQAPGWQNVLGNYKSIFGSGDVAMAANYKGGFNSSVSAYIPSAYSTEGGIPNMYLLAVPKGKIRDVGEITGQTWNELFDPTPNNRALMQKYYSNTPNVFNDYHRMHQTSPFILDGYGVHSTDDIADLLAKSVSDTPGIEYPGVLLRNIHDSGFGDEVIWNPLRGGYPKMVHPASTFKFELPVKTYLESGGSIHIKPSKRGTFTAAAKKHGKSVQAFASQVLAHKENYSSAMVKKANFARNASKWHEDGGFLQQYPDGGRIKGKNNGKYFVTELNDRREKKFQDWYANAASILGLDPNPDAYEHAYDYRGYWLNNRDADVSSPDFHFPDTWKQPHHPTFSDESIYAKGRDGVGHWDGDTFVPGPFNNIMQATEPSVTVAEEAPVTYGSNYTPSDNILQYIKDIEAFRDQWYQDGNGVWTIGYGFTGDDVRKRYPNGMTRAEADQYFADTVSRRIPMFVKATPNFDKLNQNQRDALFSYYYNIGHGGYTDKSPNMQAGLRNMDLDTVVNNIDFGYNDKKNRGLRKRRDYERKLFGTPMDYGGILNRLRNVYGDNESVKAAILRAKNVKK